MRDTFRSVGDLMGYYQFVKLKMEGFNTILPKKDTISHAPPMQQQHGKEEMYCFIGDVEKFVNVYYNHQPGYTLIPTDCLSEIFKYFLCPHLTKFHTLGELRRFFRNKIKKGERIPYRLTYEHHLGTLGKDMYKKAELYFSSLNYIVDDQGGSYVY